MSGVSDVTVVSPSDLTTRLKLVNILPAMAVTIVVVVVVVAGAPGMAPSVDGLKLNAVDLGVGGLVALSVVVTMVSVALQPFEMSLIRLLEGYWPSWRSLSAPTDAAVWLQRRRRNATLHRAGSMDAAWSRAGETARRQLSQWPERNADVLPMTLGNRLRAMERRAGRGYGMDAVASFPRLYLILPPSALGALNDLRNQLDASARFCVLSAAGAVVTALLLSPYGWWLLLPLFLMVLSFASYAAAIVAATGYGDLVSAAFSVYHLRLLQETGVKVPTDTSAVREAHAALEALQAGADDVSVEYAGAASSAPFRQRRSPMRSMSELPPDRRRRRPPLEAAP